MQESNPGPLSYEPNMSVSTLLVDFDQLKNLQIPGQPFFCSLFFFSDRRACQDFSNEKVTSRFFQTFLFLSSPKKYDSMGKVFFDQDYDHQLLFRAETGNRLRLKGPSPGTVVILMKKLCKSIFKGKILLYP